MSRQSVQEYLGVPASWPVREKIKHEIILFPSKQDIKTAKRRDPMGCALHNAACRMFDIPNAMIGDRFCYIPQRDEKGKPYIARVQATGSTQRAIRHFDKTGEMPEGGFRFIGIGKSRRLASKRKYNARLRSGEHKTKKQTHKPRQQRARAMRLLPRNLLAA